MSEHKTCPRCLGEGRIISGSFLRKLRLADPGRISLCAFAKKLDVSPAFLSQMERDLRQVPKRIADGYFAEFGEI